MTYALPTLLAVALLAGTAGAQVITLDKRHIDFGDMKQMEDRDAEVVVTNTGTLPLLIKSVDADCGCTIPELAKDNLAPGESTVIKILFNSKKFVGDTTKMVHITSNDPNNEIVSVMLTAMVNTPIIIDPPTQRLGFPKLRRGETPSREMNLTATGGQALEVTGTKTRKGLFDVQVRNNENGNDKHSVLQITVKKDIPVGRQSDNIRLTTNIEEMPYIDVDMAAWVVNLIEVQPASLSYRYKKDFKRRIVLTPFVKDLEYKITKVETDLPEIQAQVDKNPGGGVSKVLLTGSPIPKTDTRARGAKGHIKGTLTIHTNLEEQPIIEVPLSYLIRM